MTDTPPEMWMDSTGVRIEIISPHGPLYIESLAVTALRARAYGPELLRFTWDLTDPETGEVTSGAAQLRIEPLPDPRDAVTAAPPAPREEWLERPSGPPARILVDGPGCTPAEAVSLQEICRKCQRPIDPSDPSSEGRARQHETPFCRECVSACHDTEIADHWCVIDQWRTDSR